MKELNFEQMEAVSAGVNESACENLNSKDVALIEFICTLGSFTMGGALIFAPTSIGLDIGHLICGDYF